MTTRRTSQFPEVLRGTTPEPIRYRSGWTVSDGRYVIEAGFGDTDAATFVAGVADCDAMLRSVRFDGPS